MGKQEEKSADSFCRAIFNGHLLEERLLPYPVVNRSSLQDVIDAVERFGREKVNAKSIDENAKIPPEVLDEMRQMGLFGIIIPEEFGGFGLGSTGYAKIMETM